MLAKIEGLLAMPELPEVEATCSYLRERIVNTAVIDSRCLWHRTIASHTPQKFTRSIRDARVTNVSRSGKFVVIELLKEKPLFLFVHLRMSGSIDVISHQQPLAVHDRVSISLNNGRDIRFHDVRKFGRMYLTDDKHVITKNLGIEPLSDEFTPATLNDVLSKRHAQIKPLLLNQRMIAGLGNIYVDEALWKAKIHPQQIASSIPKRKIILLHEAIKTILTEAIELLGTDFGDNVVHGGMYAPKAYGRTSEPCSRCSAPITRIVVGQRGTHLCTVCQPLR